MVEALRGVWDGCRLAIRAGYAFLVARGVSEDMPNSSLTHRVTNQLSYVHSVD